MNQFWQSLRPLRRVGKLRGVIEVPAFSAECGIPKVSIYNSGNAAVDTNTSASFDLVNALTLEGWIKLNVSTSVTYLVQGESNLSYALGTNAAGYAEFSIYKSGNKVVTSNNRLPVNEWVHVAGSWDGTTMKMYVNGVLQDDTLAVASPADNRDGPSMSIAYSLSFGSANFNEIRIWSVGRTGDQIRLAMFSPRNLNGATSGIDVGLVGYFKINEGSGLSLINSIALYPTEFEFADITTTYWDTTTAYPFKYGASFVAGRFSVACSGIFSFKFSLAIPTTDTNFVPCISWQDTVNPLIVHRYRLWKVLDGFDVNPVPDLYMGQPIPANFYIEIWNLDGDITVDLENAIDLVTSILHIVSSNLDVAVTSDAAVAIFDTTLAANFPLAPFPLVFNSQQVYV